MKYNAEEFYPTPKNVLDQLTKDIDWTRVETILEPSAGSGNIVEYAKEMLKNIRYRHEIDIDCIEKDFDLRSTLIGKDYRVVHDDFLTFDTFKKYDLIIMNPPFSNGAAHLLKALDLQKNGGAIACVLNAETIRNPYTNERKVLCKKLEELNASIEYMQGAFISSEHPTGVEIAIIKVLIEERAFESRFYEELKTKSYAETFVDDVTEVAPNDFIKAIVAQYNREVEAGINLIREYKALAPYIMDDMRKDCTYSKPIISMSIDGKDLSTNVYVREVREKYWEALFKNKKFTGNMTSNLSSQYSDQVHKLKDYDFSYYNIKTVQLEMSKNLIRGIEDCIVELFDKLSYQYSYSDELSSNIHYYNGWKTNKCWYINKKVILPYMDAYRNYDRRFEPTNYSLMQQLMDIEKALNYLDGGLTDGRDMEMWLRHAASIGQTKKIELKYFYVTFYKKGTCHIEFKNEELLKKLNIFGAQNKRWLPPAYGKKKYEEMDAEEKAVVDSFEGEESYNGVIANAGYYIYDPVSSIPMLETA